MSDNKLLDRKHDSSIYETGKCKFFDRYFINEKYGKPGKEEDKMQE